jgi:hypothetical protein
MPPVKPLRRLIVAAKFGVPHTIANKAFLNFYRGEKRTRVVNRIIRSLEAA